MYFFIKFLIYLILCFLACAFENGDLGDENENASNNNDASVNDDEMETVDPNGINKIN